MAGSGRADTGYHELSWEDYEELAKDIYQALGKAHGVEIECWGRNCKVTGRSGEVYQIDVLTRHNSEGRTCRTGISCKYWNVKIGRDKVLEFFAIIDDAELTRGVMVSQMGFTRPAKNYAQHKGIGLVELRTPLDKDWDGYIRTVHGDVTLSLPPVPYDVRIHPSFPQSKGTQILGVEVEVPGQLVRPLAELMLEELNKASNERQRDITFPEGSNLYLPSRPRSSGNRFPIASLTFKVRYPSPITQEITVSADDYVYMIIKSAFGGDHLTITKDGEIPISEGDADSALARIFPL